MIEMWRIVKEKELLPVVANKTVHWVHVMSKAFSYAEVLQEMVMAEWPIIYVSR